MGFGGGGSGSFVLPNHEHTNVLADGGELDEIVSLINNGATVTMKAWMDTAIAAAIAAATQPLWELIEDYEFTGAASSKEFDFTNLTMDDHSELVLIMDGSLNAAGEIRLQLNGDTAGNYYTEGRRIAGGGLTGLTASGATYGIVASSTMIDAANEDVTGEIHIRIPKAATVSDNVAAFCDFWCGQSRVGESQYVGMLAGGTGLSKVKLFTATTFKIGTRMTLYKVKRT